MDRIQANNRRHRLLAAALSGAVLIAAAGIAQAADNMKSGKGMERCYGISKAGQNDCANASGTHAFAGESKKENDPKDWKYVAKGTCEKAGGKLKST